MAGAKAPDRKKIEEFLRSSHEKAGNKKTYTIEVVTPMFGGGVKAGEVDKDMPIRATEIRGHLRFWWRMLYGANLDPKALFDAESRLWGNAKTPSNVGVIVIQDPIDEKDNKNHWRKFSDPPVDKQGKRIKNDKGKDVKGNYGFAEFGPELYALFPAIQNENVNSKLLREEYRFILKLVIAFVLTDDERTEVENTVLAWINFGGIGARTRRGCGALKLLSANPPLAVEQNIFPSTIEAHLLEKTNSMEAWKDAVCIYQNYRQGFRGKKHKKRLKNGKVITVPGRSWWPEPDAIRTITGCSLKPKPGDSQLQNVDPSINTYDHSKSVVCDKFLNAFPRAVFGLPINFHFSDGPGKNAPAKRFLDPASAELLPNINAKKDEPSLTRMASPIITKPVSINGKWYSMIAILPYGHALSMNARLVFQSSYNKNEEKIIGKQYISGRRFVQNKLITMPSRSNAIEGLIGYLVTNGFVKSESITKQ